MCAAKSIPEICLGGTYRSMSFIISRIKKYNFLFEELVKRDFKKRYKRTYLGIFWSMLAPLLNLLVMALVFTRFFGAEIPHYIIYLFAGNLIFFYFKESTNGGMQSLIVNSNIIKVIKAPKYIFLLSRNVSSLLNFSITLILFFIFAAVDGVPFSVNFLFLLYPIICLFLLNIGTGLILSAFYVFFKDMQYLYDAFTLVLMYLSAIFYKTEVFSSQIQTLFLINPVYTYILYFRLVVLHGVTPSFGLHLLCAFYAVSAFAVGSLIYRRYNHLFINYI